MNDKRSDFPCPGIIRSGNRSSSQTHQTRAIVEGFEAKHERRNTKEARARVARNEDYLAAKRRNMTKSIRKPK